MFIWYTPFYVYHGSIECHERAFKILRHNEQKLLTTSISRLKNYVIIFIIINNLRFLQY